MFLSGRIVASCLPTSWLTKNVGIARVVPLSMSWLTSAKSLTQVEPSR